jgi:hypothetical protein
MKTEISRISKKIISQSKNDKSKEMDEMKLKFNQQLEKTNRTIQGIKDRFDSHLTNFNNLSQKVDSLEKLRHLLTDVD